jgi:biotin synthase
MNEEIQRKLETLAILERDDMVHLLKTDDAILRESLMTAAYDLKLQHLGPVVYFRGIIEFSNQCVKDCGYCGIRLSNADVDRFTMPIEEIVKTAVWAHEQKYASIVLQSGERNDSEFVDFVEEALNEISRQTNGELRVTLSLGQQDAKTYARWYEAGAKRYLLRIETTNKQLFEEIHPDGQSFDDRLQSLRDLRATGYQVGTGVMIGLPGQTAEDLVSDIIFFKDMDIDMIGMGPYLPHAGTPMADCEEGHDAALQLELGLRMIALTRLCLRDVNIAATTALQALAPNGREQGIKAGANVIMPNLTDTKYRDAYQLYDGKPCMDENRTQCMGCLTKRIESIGETIALGKWGDSPHFERRVNSEG